MYDCGRIALNENRWWGMNVMNDWEWMVWCSDDVNGIQFEIELNSLIYGGWVNMTVMEYGIWNMEYHFMIFQIRHTQLLKVYISHTGYTVFTWVYLLWPHKGLPCKEVVLHVFFYAHFSSEVTYLHIEIRTL